MASAIQSAYSRLHKRFGIQRWWPTTTAAKETEIIIGAILTQNTAWRNVEKAISNLAATGMVDFQSLAAAGREKVAALIRPSGYYNQKAERLQLFARRICSDYGSDVKVLLRKETAELREELLNMKGIGPETADSILLYAANKPVFVVDSYAKRIFSRLGICNESISYGELQQLIVAALPERMQTAAVFNQFHALLVELGKRICLKNEPGCSHCPLLLFCRCGKTAEKHAKTI
ncbi:endonuclease III domain-containing protein [Candidatus Woesearchaeota archaeon]|nr:endonuclease III domain-containing protein [Candidatus Woesearchaeota archaeon]